MASSEREQNPLFQLLKAIIAMVLPIALAYHLNLYWVRTSTDKVCHDFLAGLAQQRYEETYKALTSDNYKAQKSLQQFEERGRFIHRRYGDLRRAQRETFESKFMSGMATVVSRGLFQEQILEITVIVVRSGSNWKVAHFSARPVQQ